ncbi:MAG: hypothetical protein J3Q66DRAFT_326014 [Benniella sp.]|nr:MAG: hypothetical protein J3Q66DRAFT_326014 [Benniella sp.]
MKTNTLSVLSVFLAVITVAQAAPSSVSREKTAPYYGVNPNDPHDTISGYTELYPENAPIPDGPASLSCWGRYFNGPEFGITCDGDQWYAWAKCSNNKQYVGGPIEGRYNAVITCPAGYTAVDGGAYGS